MNTKKGNVLIFGGSGNLGQAVVSRLTEAGYRCYVADIKQPERAHGYFEARANNYDDLQELSRRCGAENLGFDHMVNTVGALKETGISNLFDTSYREILDTMDLNFLGQVLPIRCMTANMSDAENRSITLVSSINAHTGYSIPFYSASKAALHGFVRPAAIDLGRLNIRLNIVTPGSVENNVTAKQGKDFNDRAQAAALKRLCTSDHVAHGIQSCIELTGMTGQEIIIDAGQMINPASSIYRQEDRGIRPPLDLSRLTR